MMSKTTNIQFQKTRTQMPRIIHFNIGWENAYMHSNRRKCITRYNQNVTLAGMGNSIIDDCLSSFSHSNPVNFADQITVSQLASFFVFVQNCKYRCRIKCASNIFMLNTKPIKSSNTHVRSSLFYPIPQYCFLPFSGHFFRSTSFQAIISVVLVVISSLER